MLKSLFVAATFATVLSPVSQAVEFVNADGSSFSQLCIAAAQSQEEFERQANDLSLSTYKASNIKCNNMPIGQFANQYRGASDTATVTVFAFENANNTPEAELCIAAAISNETFTETKNRLFGNTTIRNVSCNGVNLANFARRFNKSFNG